MVEFSLEHFNFSESDCFFNFFFAFFLVVLLEIFYIFFPIPSKQTISPFPDFRDWPVPTARGEKNRKEKPTIKKKKLPVPATVRTGSGVLQVARGGSKAKALTESY